jgi:small subunit ribosomal protein S4
MARYRGPKNRLARREGMDLGLQTPGSKGHAQLLKRLKITPGPHGQKGSRRKVSDYGLQLREKQKVKRMYGLLIQEFEVQDPFLLV